ncbi:single-stranded nucleic acid binding r3h [Alternaria burnsii]|uniref:Single-stranded nucleic acid binding r3h n=1 Tax=Alternaria burnsii TaxID=1187904 RepID=A0A8H7B6M7_9PLEO|nr:single-stranded nucleic acid binding r3h [Alternaria burnsii]KAF7678164.1 single-stranded nucleic acid binding r3h [Alternaria burnsii]
MASATPAPAEQAPPRPLSFAKVAASAIKPQTSKDSAPQARPPVATPRIPAVAQKARSIPMNGEVPPRILAEKQEDNDASKSAENAISPPAQQTSTAELSDTPSTDPKGEAVDRPQSAAVVKVSVTEDSSTQLSSSDGSGKPPSVDGKSVASATTFALDEKESLRPDDSASLRAVEEEDVTSPPDSVVADSRQGSDHGAARAFRDQLHEIAVMNPQPKREGPPGRFPTLTNGPQTLYDPNQSLNSAGLMSQPMVNGMPSLNGVPNMPAIPDEKLLEALRSPRDRLFVVKIEQDFIDFIKDSRENELCLPNCNTFYRMLAHRLADYYLLGHVVDTTMTGVKITRTPYCRIPPPVSQMVDPAKGTNTPPVELPARKIMRRDDGKSGTNTGANSQNASKTTSEMGGSEGSNDGEGSKDKAALSREEREARYREARQRIFGSAESEEPEVAESNGPGEDKNKGKDISRSSSAAGKKKPKKQRNYDDDDFQARSRFNVYYPQQYPVATYTGDNAVYYNGYPGPAQNAPYATMNPGASPPTAFSNPYPGMMAPEAQSQYGWAGQQYQASNGSMMPYPGYGQASNGYDISADFQRGMSSFQSAGMPSQVTPKMANPQMASYQDTYQQPQHMPVNSGWSHANQQPSFHIAQGAYNAQNGPGNRPMSAPHQAPMPGYSYGQFASNAYNGKSNRNQHPLPGSYNRGQFNPQTQAFVPGGRNIPFGMQQNMMQGQPQLNGYGGYQMSAQTSMPAQMPRPNPSSNSTPSFGSPQSIQGNNSATSMNRIASQTGEPGSSQSSIAKYGTPSHLPPKPPAPAPAPPFALPSMTRVPSSGLANNAPTTSTRGGSGNFNNNTNPN